MSYVRGGQGRSDEAVEADAESTFWFAVAMTFATIGGLLAAAVYALLR